MAEIKVKARTRKPGGKGVAKRLRAEGKVPGIVYGRGIEPIPIEMKAGDVHALMHGATAGSLESRIVTLEIEERGEDSPRPTLITEIQRDPIKGNVVHIDFHQVSMMEKIHARIPVFTVGDCPGVSGGGVLEHALRELDVACMAKDLPEEIRIDISNLALGASVRVRDIALGAGVEILHDPDLSLVSVLVPRVIAEAEAPAKEEEIAEPEVITEKKAEEEEEEGGKEKKKE